MFTIHKQKAFKKRITTQNANSGENWGNNGENFSFNYEILPKFWFIQWGYH